MPPHLVPIFSVLWPPCPIDYSRLCDFFWHLLWRSLGPCLHSSSPACNRFTSGVKLLTSWEPAWQPIPFPPYSFKQTFFVYIGLTETQRHRRTSCVTSICKWKSDNRQLGLGFGGNSNHDNRNNRVPVLRALIIMGTHSWGMRRYAYIALQVVQLCKHWMALDPRLETLTVHDFSD